MNGDEPVVTHRFRLIGGHRLHLLDFGGAGRPIILLHGVTGNAWMWARVIPLLRNVGRPLALDLRGFGDSQWSAEHRYQTVDHARDVSDLIDDLGAERVDLVGLSWGGLVALETTLSRPEAVRRLVMVETPTHFRQSATDVPEMAESFTGAGEVREAWLATNPGADPEMIDLMSDHGTRPGTDGRLFRKQDPYYLTRWPFREDDYRERLGEIRQPTLVVRAEDSHVLSAIEAAETVRALPDVRLVEVAGSGHLVAVDRPRELGQTIAAFLGEGT